MMRKPLLITALIVSFLFTASRTNAQWGYSPYVDSLVSQVTDSTVSLLVRQLSGDTTIMLGGSLDSIMSRYSTHPDNAKAAEFILEKFESYGLDARIQSYDANGENVIATITGDVYPNKMFIICGHYDSQPPGSLAPGADDNASGTVAVLEAARVLSNESFDCTVKFIAFDEEEQGLIGSSAYADSAFAWGYDIQGVINLDMIAWDANDDGVLSVASDNNSLDLYSDYIEILRIYEPGLHAQYLYINASDHASFWNYGWKALLAIEEFQDDFNSYYHTTSDLFQYLNVPYFSSMARGAIAALATIAWDYKVDMVHTPLVSSLRPGKREVSLTVGSDNTLASGNNGPKLWYRRGDDVFQPLSPVMVEADTFTFEFPDFCPGQMISYYFAVQDSAGNFVSTLPEGGSCIDPPGNLPGDSYYTFFTLNDISEQYCLGTVPDPISFNQTTLFPLTIPDTGIIHDIDVSLSISHNTTGQLNIFLVHPDGTQVELSTENGYYDNNYTGTVFDDEATTCINQHRSPFTGSFRPEEPLSTLDGKKVEGEWNLKIYNSGPYLGSLTNLCLDIKFSNRYYFVDSAVALSGHGMTWDSAFNSVGEALAHNPGPGERVFIKPGTYNEDVEITSNGEVILPAQSDVSVYPGDTIKFNSAVDLSGVDLENYPGEYYALVFRSRYSNNGYFPVLAVDDANDQLIVGGAGFLREDGASGDTTKLSAALVRPVVYQKCSDDPENERVVLDAEQSASIGTIMYIGDAIGDGSYDASPANANIIKGIDLTNSGEGGGVHLQSSSYNVYAGSQVYETNGAGIYLNGNADRPARYNLIVSNEIWNTPFEGMYIGAGGMPEYNNHAHFNHLIDNDIYTSGTGTLAQLENAIDLKENNYCNVVEGNTLRDFDLVTDGNSAVDIRNGQEYALVYGNVFIGIGMDNSGTSALVQVYEDNTGVEIFNNLMINSAANDEGLYALRLDGTSHTGSGVFHNTIYNVENGFLLEDYGSDPDFFIRNNIVFISDTYFENWGTGGRFEVSHNLYQTDPTPESYMPYYGSTGRQVGDPIFADTAAEDFRLTVLSTLAINRSASLTNGLKYDREGNKRYLEAPDIGAFEIEGKIVWTGDIDSDWHTSGNWSFNSIPDSNSTVVIPPASNEPVLGGSGTDVGAVIVLEGAGLTINAVLEAVGRKPSRLHD